MTPFPDVEAALLDLLADLGGTGTRTPPDLQSVMPFLRVQALGGTDDTLTDTSRVDVEVFTPTRAASLSLAETVRQRLLAGPHVANGVLLDLVRTDVRPHEVPWDDPGVRRFTASYAVSARR